MMQPALERISRGLAQKVHNSWQTQEKGVPAPPSLIVPVSMLLVLSEISVTTEISDTLQT
jgi:hypothetical protein